MAETNPTPEPTPQDDQGSTDKGAPDPTTKTVPLSALEKERKQRQELAVLPEPERCMEFPAVGGVANTNKRLP